MSSVMSAERDFFSFELAFKLSSGPAVQFCTFVAFFRSSFVLRSQDPFGHEPIRQYQCLVVYVPKSQVNDSRLTHFGPNLGEHHSYSRILPVNYLDHVEYNVECSA
mmetsp:Transcript_34308/g.86313  ORF Transcript_34308/g.86313 Transcript_34308/m.86313 type:complete len:106 (+) Transcript_34308:4674-4991(+)